MAFCDANPNFVAFEETLGTYTEIYPEYFDETGNLLDNDKVPPTLLAYHRAHKKGIMAIDSDYNLISIKVCIILKYILIYNNF